MKKVIALVFIFCLFTFNQQVFAATVPTQVGDIFVQDFANILNDEQKHELIQLGEYIEKHTEAQLAVLTVHSLNDQSVVDYALQAYQEYKLGGKDNNGVLLLIALDDRKIHIEVGNGLDSTIPDEKIGRIIEIYALPYLEDDHISEAIINTYKQLYNEIANQFKLNSKADAKGFEYDGKRSSIYSFIIILTIFIVLVILDFRFLKGAISLSVLRVISRVTRRRGSRMRDR